MLDLNLIKKIIPDKNIINERKYIFNVNEYISATNPIIAGIIKKDEKPIVIKLVTVVAILSLDCLTVCLIIIGTKLADVNPYKKNIKSII